MGGRGTYSKGKNPVLYYYCIGKIDGVKILKGIGNFHRLPEESHNSKAYIKVDENGTFQQYREFNSNHQLIIEIGYHREKSIDKHAQKVLHIHHYTPPGDFNNRPARRLTESELNKYRKFLVGLNV